VGSLKNGVYDLRTRREGEKMKGFIEEYGGVIAACILGLISLGFISSFISPDGTFLELVKMLFKGVGSTIMNGRS
jgi:hypothetical protein